jgi:hypothetical protein
MGVFVRCSVMSTQRLPESGYKNMNTLAPPLVLAVFSSGPPRRHPQRCPGVPEHLLGSLVHAHLRTAGVVGAGVDLEHILQTNSRSPVAGSTIASSDGA